MIWKSCCHTHSAGSSLPPSSGARYGDSVDVLHRLAAAGERYDVVVHDTGGACCEFVYARATEC